MTNLRKRLLRAAAAVAGLVVAGMPTTADAVTINTTTDPLLTGATVIDFTEVPLGTADPTIGNVSFTGEATATTVNNQNTGSQNPLIIASPILLNQTVTTSGTNIDISFIVPVSVFGMHLGAVNTPTTIQAFDNLNIFLGSG